MNKIYFLSFLMLLASGFAYAQYPGGVSASSTNELWLDAYQYNGVDNAQVSSWTDESGNGNHAIQSIGYRKPRYRSNGVNGMPGIDFDGTFSYLYIPANSNFNSNQSTHFIVYERSTVNTGSNCLFNMDFSEASNLIFTSTSPSISRASIKNSSAQQRRIDFGGATNNILTSIWNGSAGTLNAFLNGVQGGPIGNAANTATGHNLSRIGAFNTNYKFNGNMGEVIYYTSVLNSAERNIVENYLAAKYQISISGDMYGHETTHNFDVIGVGQESDGNNLTASGTSNLDLSVGSLNNGEYVFVGHDNGGYVANTTDAPSGYNRYNQIWKSTLTGYAGTVDLAFDVSTYGLGSDTAYKLLVDADGVFASGATEYSGVYAGGIVTFTGVTLNNTDFFTLANSDFAIVSTGVTNDWHLTTTWSCGCIPSSGSSATILTGHNVFINGQNAQVGDLTVDGSLFFNSTDTLEVSGDLTNNNTITSGSGTFKFVGASLAQSITGAVQMNNITLDNPLGLTINTSLGVQGWLDVINGTLTTNNALTLMSNSTGTAAFYRPSAGDISGNYTVERYLNEGESWYLLAPVVQTSGTLEDWNQEFEMQGFTGTEWPGGISSVYYFDQNNIVSYKNQGYTVPSSTFDVVDPKVGYEIYIGDDTKATGARTIDMTGAPVLGNVSYTCPHLAKIGNPSEDGWNLITNPYPAPVRWGSVVKSGNFDVAYRKKTDGSSTTILNSWLIASGEAFWVHANSGGCTIDFQNWMAGFNEDITDTYNQKTSTNNPDPMLNIKLSYTYNTVLEENFTYVGFSADATDLKDNGIDAFKLNNLYGDKPNLSTTNDGYQMEYNILSKNNTSVIPVNVITEYPSTALKNYTLSFENVADVLLNNKTLTLEDRELNTFTDLTADYSVAVSMWDTVTQPRFFLHVASPLTTSQTDVTCYGANDGKILADGFAGDSKNYTWKDEFNIIIASSNGVLGADSISNLTPGTYTVEVTNTVSSQTVVNTFVISEPNDISVGFYSMFSHNDEVDVTSTNQNDTLTVFVSEQVDFESMAQNASTFNWNFGDLTFSSLENPTHTYFNTGVYKVEFTAGNGSCDKTAMQYIQVVNATGISETNLLDDIIVYNIDNDLIISFNNESSKEFTVNIYNNLGQDILMKRIVAGVNHQEKLTLNNAKGVYFVTVKDGDATKTEKIVITKE